MASVLEPVQRPTRRRSTKSASLLVASDGSAKAAPAVRFAKLLAASRNWDVRVGSVIDVPSTLWLGGEPSGGLTDSAALEDEIAAKVKEQISDSGDAGWPLAISSGDFTERITTLARDTRAKLLLVGFRSHGGLARLFGRETVLRLARMSDTPILAVTPDLETLPRRIVVGMDFSLTSIEAARLAMEIAARDATIVLAHVVPWAPREYVPAEWISSYEATVGAELTRVTHWLEERSDLEIRQRLLYGNAGAALPQFAERFGADLLVVGAHQRGPMGRVLAGQTVGKLIRRAHCSVLIRPASVPVERRSPARSDS